MVELKTKLKSILVLVILIICIDNHSDAHGIVLNKQSGQLFELSETYVDVQIDNQIAIVRSEQVFLNRTGEEAIIKYGFPLSADANPIRLRWKIDDNDWKEAIVDESTQNTSIPQTSTGSGTISSNSISDYIGASGLYFEPADTISTGSRITMEMTYVQLLPYSFGQVSFHYPYDYSPIQFEAPELSYMNIVLTTDRNLDNIETNFAQSTITSDTSQAVISFEERFVRLEKDFTLNYGLLSDNLGITTLSTMLPDSLYTCDNNGSGYVSMIIEPEANDQVDVIEKNFTLIIDQSGSMAGRKIIQAREAASFIVNNLNEGDRFNIISFSSGVNSLFAEHQDVNEQNKSTALHYISNIPATGSTNISGSLSEAISQFDSTQDDRANIIIFFTDGQATSGLRNTQDILSAVEDQVQSSETNIFLFTFGIGQDVDKTLLTLLALNNSGLVQFLDNEELQLKITEFFLKINNPVLVNIDMSLEPAGVIYETYPSLDRLPNLYKGEQLIVSGRYDSAQTVIMRLEGQAYNLDVNYEFPIELTADNVIEKSFLPKIWAKQKIDNITIQYHAETNTVIRNELQQDIDGLGICYGVVSLAFNGFIDGTTLEIDLLDFIVRNNEDDHVHISWSTASENNNQYYVVQRSQDNKSWTDIKRIEGAGTSQSFRHYSITDNNPLSGTSYYRLKQVDYNGEEFFSDVRAVHIDDRSELLVYPNPVKAGQHLNVISDHEEDADLFIFNIQGQLVMQAKMKNGMSEINIDELQKGTYICYLSKEKPKHFSFYVR